MYPKTKQGQLPCLFETMKCVACEAASLCLCCVSRQCNWLIFPPCTEVTYTKKSIQKYFRTFKNRSQQEVPYFSLTSTGATRSMIFFHGNGQDIGTTLSFVGPIAQKLNLNIFAMEYPSYGQYQVYLKWLISNKIKENAEDLYTHLSELYPLGDKTVVVGRSIGSGGATYLASRKKLKNLILISPFSNIQKVGSDFLKCFGCVSPLLIKKHFDNQQELQKYNGKLLIIHGQSDEVIDCRHGRMLAEQYLRKNPKQLYQKFPKHMTHNNFDYESDILGPIVHFLQE